MPRKFKLTWQPGSSGSGGRWRKKYKGKTYYLGAGSGKFDRDAYIAALETWDLLKAKIDADLPRPHQLEYEYAIGEWEQVLAWSNRHGNQEMAVLAFEKLEALKHRMETPVLRPLPVSDRFEFLFKVPTVPLPDDFMKQVAADLAEGNVQIREMPELTPSKAAEIAGMMDGGPTRIAREVWMDRLKMQQRRAVIQEDSVFAHIEEYIRHKQQQKNNNELSAGRVYAIGLHLNYFGDWLGRDTAISEIAGSILLKYQSHLLDNLKSKEWSKTTAQHYLKTVKAFVRWLWQVEAIPSLPRVLDGKAGPLKIRANTATPVVFTLEEVRKLLEAASDRTKLYILLMINCGMTQKDISDLKWEEVDWSHGRIVRKRSKTSDHENVPVVNYLLWLETLRLLEQERTNENNGRVLKNANGSALCTEVFTEDGKYKKTDNIKNAFDRLRKKEGINKPLKSFKKTSATLVKGDERFNGLEDLFLGHAPNKMSDKHYTQVPSKLLDQAILWLESQYEIGKISKGNCEASSVLGAK